MAYPQDYPRLTFKFEKDENGKLVLDSDGNPIKKYLLYDNNERTGYRELTKDEVVKMISSLEEKEGHTNGNNC
jgi:hypothetical protein